MTTKSAWLLIPSITIIGSCLLFVLHTTFLLRTCRDTFCYGTHLTGDHIGGRKYQDVAQTMQEKIQTQQAAVFHFIYQDRDWELTARELEISYDTRAVDNAFAKGKQGPLTWRIRDAWEVFMFQPDNRLVYDYNQEFWKNFIDLSVQNELALYPTETETSIKATKEGVELISTPGSAGSVVDERSLTHQLNARLAQMSNLPITIQTEHARPLSSQTNHLSSDLATQMQNPTTISLQNQTGNPIATIDIATLTSWVRLTPTPSFIPTYTWVRPNTEHNYISGTDVFFARYAPRKDYQPSALRFTFTLRPNLDMESVNAYVTDIASLIEVPAINARLQIDEAGTLSIISPSKDGLGIDYPRTYARIRRAFYGGEAIAHIDTKSVPAAISESNLRDFDTMAVLGHARTDYTGSSSSRVHNVQLGATKFNGVVVAPGEEFSFNRYLGDISAAEGYLPQLVIKGNSIIPEYGGGICQVSTTIFRAALNAGLPITDRRAHSFVVSYYGQPGLDATIYSPSVDLKFRNDTQGYLLVQTSTDGPTIDITFYGSLDLRQVKLGGPYLYDQKQDGALKAKVDYTVTDAGGKVMTEDTFYSNYKSPALFSRQ